MRIAAGPNDDGSALTLRDRLVRLIAWREDGRLLHVHFMRNFLTGAPTFLTLRARITAVDTRSIELQFEGGTMRSLLTGAEVFDGPITVIDAVANTREDFEAVQLKLRGGDSLLIATQEIETGLTQLAGLSLPRLSKAE